MPAGSDQQRRAEPMDLLPGALGELVHIRALIEALLLGQRDDILQVVVGDFDRREAVLMDSPSTHAKRLIVPRFGLGGNGLAVPAGVVTEVCEQNEGRLGGLIVNTGTSPVRLYLAVPGDIGGTGNPLSNQAPNRPSTYLAANGSFDFRLGNVLYGGTVCAAGVGGASTLDWLEF